MPSADVPVRSPRFGVRGLALAGLLIGVLALAGCTKAPTPDRSSPAASVSPTTTTSSPAPSNNTSGATNLPTAVSPSSTSTSTAPTSAPRPTSSAPVSPSQPAGPPACTTSQLAIGVQRLSGAAGHQYAQIQFANSSAATCSLYGFPGVTLLHGGQALGQPAGRSTMTPKLVTLKPSGRAGALLTDASTCNADLSDGVQVIVPNRTETVRLALSLRGCALTIDPVVAG